MENPSGIAALGINWKFLISQGVNFLLLVLILRWLLYKPVTKMLEGRRQKIADSMAQAEKNKKEAEELEIKNKEEINKTKKQALQIMEEAKTEAKEQAKMIKEKTSEEAKKILDRVQKEIALDRNKMIISLKKELAELIILASGKLTKKTIKPEVQRKLVDDVIRDLENNKIM